MPWITSGRAVGNSLFSAGYNNQFQLVTGFSGVAIVASVFLIKRKPVTATTG